MAGYEFKSKKPFNNVYFTGIVRDKSRRKMSKSLGNSPDALKLIDQYSADGVRVGLMLSSAAGNDLLFDTSLCDQGKSFSNKIWNSFRLVKGWKVVKKNQPTHCSIVIEWYNQKFNSVLSEINDHFNKFTYFENSCTNGATIWCIITPLLFMINASVKRNISTHMFSF